MPSAAEYHKEPTKYKEERKLYYQNNREKTLATNKRYRVKNHASVLAHIKDWQDRNRTKTRASSIATRRKRNGFPKPLFEARLLEQGGMCPICGVVLQIGQLMSAAAADHDHVTNSPRGVLCKRCNLLLGTAKDDVAVLMKAIDYLNRWRI